ncbi:MAG: PP2C family protein-serine/threonine phosphatase, partial [Thermoanaerobaculia bacterium]
MDSQTVERIFGGITYLFNASSTGEFFSNLEAFVHELFGPVGFSVLSASPGRRLQLQYSNRVPDAAGKEAPSEPRCDLLLELLGKQEDLPFRALPEAPPLLLGTRRLPVHGARLMSDGSGRFAWVVFHDPPSPEACCGEVFGAEALAFDHIASAYFRCKDQEHLEASLNLLEAKLAAINDLGELICHLDLDLLLTKLMELSLFLVSAQVGSVVLCGEQGVESRVEWGLPLDIVRRLRHRDGPAVLDRVLLSGQPELIQDFNDPGRYQGVPDLQVDSYLCIPLLTKGKILGAINLINSSQESGFTQEDRESMLTVSGLAATAIENAILHHHSLEKERMSEQLRIAQSIQNRMYPKVCPKSPSYETAWVNLSCDETGGDYFDFIPAGEDRLAVVIGDASGHGIG